MTISVTPKTEEEGCMMHNSKSSSPCGFVNTSA